MPDWLVPLVTLTAMEIVLGIDNIIFLAIVAARLPGGQQAAARRVGLLAALAMRLLLLFAINFILGLTQPLFELPAWALPTDEARAISTRDLILLAGGLFLIGKSTYEIHHKLEGAHVPAGSQGRPGGGESFVGVLTQIVLLDIIFSLDSVITAIGMVRLDAPAGAAHGGTAHGLWVIVAAMVITVVVMLWFAGPVARFVERHPTLKILALSFLILIGVLLAAEGLGQHLNKGYIYFAMAFSFAVEMLNLRIRARPPVALHEPPVPAR